MGFSIIKHPFWGIPFSGNPHINVQKNHDSLDERNSETLQPRISSTLANNKLLKFFIS
jgi:hypothetical protein